jgi:disulfide bond formation protein DsbB
MQATSLFFALLAIAAQAAVATATVLAIGSRLSPSIAATAEKAAAAVRPNALWLACAVATVCTAGSLYFSEVAHFVPCRLCWYQRICMYPLVPLLAIAAARRDTGIRIYGGTLAAIGALIAVYHVLVERFPSLESNVCDPTNPCTLIWVERFGYLTIPTMALSGFALVLTLLTLSKDPS